MLPSKRPPTSRTTPGCRSRYSMMIAEFPGSSSRSSSRSTGNLPVPPHLEYAARSAGSPRLTDFGVELGMSFSYSAISAFQQNDDKRVKIQRQRHGNSRYCDKTNRGVACRHRSNDFPTGQRTFRLDPSRAQHDLGRSSAVSSTLRR